MSTASARVLMDFEIRDIINDGVRRGHLSPKMLLSLAFRNGTSDGQINKVYGVTTSDVAASTTTVVDLIGSLTDVDGAVINFDEVVLLVIHNTRTTALAYLSVGPDATAGFGTLASSLGFWADATDRSIVAPDGWLVLYSPAGVPAAAGSTDELAIITSAVAGSTNGWELIIAGRAN